ncbi:hypothetical protein C7999DRAFT_44198 [Corynascus novoguineensis]|uniref:Uncharacterized protein n=1 Tax=Corynascus novoguineensis TaxID=1126955 RepID=A0AAN7CL42_9PEZI|nr:hypothetical protein C7999DRAFT_44198 [Corynascus novoguineensis]
MNAILPENEIYDDFDEIRPGWLLVLDDMLRTCSDSNSEYHLDYIIASLIKQYLLSDDDGVAYVFAQRFDDLYSTVYQPQFDGYRGEHKGWAGYFIAFYDTVCRTAVQIPYSDSKQDKMIQLLQSEFEWVDSEIWSDHLLLPERLWKYDPGEIYRDSSGDLNSPKNLQSLKRESADYVNFHAFNARCVAGGLDARYRAQFGHEGHRISVGLQPGFPEYPAPWVDCQVLVAAQYIVLAGDAIDAECVKKQLSPPRRGWRGWENGNGPSVWKHWAIQLGKIADALQRGEDPGFRVLEDNRETLIEMVKHGTRW